ncbi:MAG TPA: matrixin family metalloprotease [Polyangiaceae bacterium]
MNPVAPESPNPTPSRPPPGSIPFSADDTPQESVTRVGHALPATPPLRSRRAPRWPIVTLSAALGCISSTLAFDTLDSETQAIEHSSRPTAAEHAETDARLATSQRWMVPDVQVVIDESVHAITPEAEQAIVQAFGAWLSASPNLPELNIEHGRGLKPRLDPDGVNAVVYAPIEFPGHEDDLAITIGFSDEETGEITEADIIINSRHAYSHLNSPIPGAPSTSCDGTSQASVCDYRYDLQNVMTHEVGHFYGLGEDREDRTATMYSCTSACETHKRDVSDGDRQTMGRLYKDALPKQYPAVNCDAARVAPRGPTWGWAGALALGLVAFARRRRA